MEKVSDDVTVHLMYDIACMLVRHLKTSAEGFALDKVKFSVPSFHAYGHNAPCQVCRCIKQLSCLFIIVLIAFL